MQRCTRSILVTLATLSAIACSPSKTSRVRTQAPQGPTDLGVVTTLNSARDVEKILELHEGIQVRPLNTVHGLYEFFGTSEAEIHSVVPSAKATDNTYFSFQPLAVPGDGAEVDGLPRCKADNLRPEARVYINGTRASRFAATTIELGQPLEISAEDSRPHPQRPSTLRIAIKIEGPGFSTESKKPRIESKVKIVPDALGVYQIGVLVQDDNDACSIEVTPVVVTANRPFKPQRLSHNPERKFFRHLKAVAAEESWRVSQGEGVIIAVVDTGVDYNHPWLASNILQNVKEKADGQDDDKNGFVDDVLGYDFVNSDPFPYDDDGHGTHVAGLAAATEIGLAPKAKILAVKALSSIGGDAGSVAAGILYAVDRGANVINLSLGSTTKHPALLEAVQYAEKKGVLLVVSAGNGDPMLGLGFDLDKSPVFPASYPQTNILTVAALDENGALTSYSNFGSTSVDVAAPGGTPEAPIFSAAFENPKKVAVQGLYGTSMAAPIVTGIAAQVAALHPGISPVDLRQALLQAGPEDVSLANKVVSGRRLNANEAVRPEMRQLIGL